MKNFIFKIKKTTESEVEIQAESQNIAMQKIAEMVSIEEEKEYEENIGKEIEYNINLEKIEDICSKKHREILKKVTQNIEEILSKNEQENEDFDDENEEILEKNNFKVICNKCGNCIDLSEDFG